MMMASADTHSIQDHFPHILLLISGLSELSDNYPEDVQETKKLLKQYLEHPQEYLKLWQEWQKKGINRIRLG